MIGKTISHYRILEKLGEGGMGVVYRAEDTKLKRTVALKFITPQGIESVEDKARFIHEAQAAASLSRPNICTVYEIDEAEGHLFLAMELIEGESLKERISRGPLKIEETLDIVLQAAQGLNAAHEKGIVHRDIKPGNIMVEKTGLVKIMDFGLAKLPGRSKLTKTGTTLGTVAYMSPEQARGAQVDRRSDVWSLGAVAYEMVTGRQPFKGDYEQAVLYSIMNEAPEPLTAVRVGVPMELDRIVGKALAKNPDERHQHADDLIADLRALKKSLDSGITSHPTAAPAAKPSKRGLSEIARILIPACIVVAAVVALIFLKPALFGGAIATARKPVTIITFVNDTGDPQYDNLKKVIPNLLITSLEQSKYLHVVTWERMRDILKQMGKESVEDIGQDLGYEICQREGISAIVTGSFTKLGDKFVTDIKVLRVQSKDIITSANAEGRGVESIPGQVDRLSRSIARGIGLSEPEIEEAQRSVIDVTTSSMEAYTWYLKGLEAYGKVYFAEAIRDLSRAVEMDSTFAVAHLRLGIIYSATNNVPQARKALAKALSYAAKATERERLYIEARCATTLENNREKAMLLLRELLKKYPREKLAFKDLGQLYQESNSYDQAILCFNRALKLDPAYGLALLALGYTNVQRGDFKKALELFQKYAALYPAEANPYDSMGDAYFFMGKLDEAIGMYARAYELQPELGSASQIARCHGARGEFNDAISWIDKDIQLNSWPGQLILGYCWKSVFHCYAGRFRQASMNVQRADAIADSIGNTPMLTVTNSLKGLLLLESGDFAVGRAAMERANKYMMPPYELSAPNYAARAAFYRALVNLKSNDIPAVAAELAEMKNLMPAIREKTPELLRSFKKQLAMVSAELSLAQGRPGDAIKCSEKELDIYAPHATGGTLGTLYPTVNDPFDQDIIPRAYAAKGDLRRAITEYEKLLTFDPASRDRRLRNPRYEYRLAKLLEKRGDSAKALTHYEKFLDYWKDADSDRPELIDAKARVAMLKSPHG